MTEQVTVRLATQRDANGVLDLCRMIWAENALFTMDDELVRSKIHGALHGNGGLIGVIGEQDNLHGCIMLEIGQQWYTRDHHLCELFNFVHPDHRKSDYAKQLAKYAEQCAVKLGLPLVIGVITNERTEGKVRLYRRWFGVPAGAFFVVNGNWPTSTRVNDTWNAMWKRFGRDSGRDRLNLQIKERA